MIDMRLIGGGVIADKACPHTAWGPNLRHGMAGGPFGHGQIFAAIAIEKGRHPCIHDTVDMNSVIADAVHGGHKLLIIPFGGGVKGHGDVNIVKAESLNRSRFIGQGAFVAVQPQIDDMPDTQRGQLVKLVFARLA